jgi:glycerophosphoryl diester phosphodiesterase
MDLTTNDLASLQFHVDQAEFACPPDKIRSAKIPTLRQVLELYQGTSVIVKIELKGPDVVDGVLALVQELQMQHQCHYASFHHERIQQIRQLHPEVQSDGITHVYPTGALFADDIPPDYIAQALQVGASEVHLKYDTCTTQRVRDIHHAGMRSMAWFRGPVGMYDDCHSKYKDVTEENEDMYRIVAMTGVQQICCNKPKVLIDMLNPRSTTTTTTMDR